MSDDIKVKMSLSDKLYSSFALREKKPELKSNNTDTTPSTSYEVFRNNTTAVEVVVKEVPRNMKKVSTSDYHDSASTKRLHEDVDRLRKDLNKANKSLERTRTDYRCCLREMQKQVDTANQREIDTRAQNLALQLENEKLKTFLVSKTNLVNKLKKELNSLRRIIKFVLKSILSTPQVEPPGYDTSNSDPEYEDFENNLKKDIKVKFAPMNEMSTFDSTMSKDPKTKIVNRLYE